MSVDKECRFILIYAWHLIANNVLFIVRCMYADEPSQKLHPDCLGAIKCFPVCCNLQIPSKAIFPKIVFISTSSTEWKSLTCFIWNVWNGHLSYSLYLHFFPVDTPKPKTYDRNSSSLRACKKLQPLCRPRRVFAWPFASLLPILLHSYAEQK